jgi:hypothetical protein
MTRPAADDALPDVAALVTAHLRRLPTATLLDGLSVDQLRLMADTLAMSLAALVELTGEPDTFITALAADRLAKATHAAMLPSLPPTLRSGGGDVFV